MSDYVYPGSIGNPNEITVNNFAKEIVKLTGTNQSVINLPLPIDNPIQRRPDKRKLKNYSLGA